jgi:hypothetical protein
MLRLWQYLADSSLGIDEAALARNIVDRSVGAIFGPLDYAQVAPLGFLLVQKAVVAALGSSEYALRLFPLVCGIAALLVFAWLASNLLQGWAAPFAVGMFALGSPFVYFSSQMKQYSSDIAASVLIVSAALWSRSQPHDVRRAFALGIVGAAAVWFSQSAFFVIAGVGASMAGLVLWERRQSRPEILLIVGTMWGVSLAAAAAVALRNVSAVDREYLEWFWSAGFWSLPPRSLRDFRWPLDQMTWAFGAFASGPRRTNGGLNYPWSFVFVIIMLVGYAVLWKRRRDAALFLSMPALLTLAASAFHLYPFTGRLVAFLLPSFLLATAAGADWLLAAWPERFRFATPALLAILGGAPLYAAATSLPPERIEDIRPVLARIATQRRAGDAMYAYYGAGQAVLYYAPRFGLGTRDLTIGRCSVADPREYLRELDRFRGRPRLWVMATHLRRGTVELQVIRDYLDSIGRRLESIVIPASTNAPPQGAYAFLYDLSDPGRLGSSSSENFSVPRPPMDDGLTRWSCYGTPAPLRL